MTEYTLHDARDNPSVKSRFIVEKDGERIASCIELHEALWTIENDVTK